MDEHATIRHRVASRPLMLTLQEDLVRSITELRDENARLEDENARLRSELTRFLYLWYGDGRRP